MRAHNKLRAFPRQIGAPSQDLLVRLSELIFEFSQTVVSMDLVEKLADHAAELSGALNAAVLLNTESEWQVAAISNSSSQLNAATKAQMAKKITRLTNGQMGSPPGAKSRTRSRTSARHKTRLARTSAYPAVAR